MDFEGPPRFVSNQEVMLCEFLVLLVARDHESYDGMWLRMLGRPADRRIRGHVRRCNLRRGVPSVLFLIVKIEDCTILDYETCYTRHTRIIER